MDRRNFIGGLAALAAVAALPAPAEATWIGVDLGKNEGIMSIYVDGMPVENLVMEGSNDGQTWHIITTHSEGPLLYVDDLETSRYYKLSIKQDDEEIYATDLQLVSDQRVYDANEGKLKRMFGWRGRSSSEKNGGSITGRFASASPNFEERRRSKGGPLAPSDNG